MHTTNEWSFECPSMCCDLQTVLHALYVQEKPKSEWSGNTQNSSPSLPPFASTTMLHPFPSLLRFSLSTTPLTSIPSEWPAKPPISPLPICIHLCIHRRNTGLSFDCHHPSLVCDRFRWGLRATTGSARPRGRSRLPTTAWMWTIAVKHVQRFPQETA